MGIVRTTPIASVFAFSSMMTRLTTKSALSLFLATLCPYLQGQSTEGSPNPTNATASLDRVREAMGMTDNPAWRRGIIFTGDAMLLGIEQTFERRNLPDGRYLRDNKSALPMSSGFDGKVGWKVDWTGMPCVVDSVSLHHEQLLVGARSGYWLDPRYPIAVKTLDATAKLLRFELQLGLKQAKVRS